MTDSLDRLTAALADRYTIERELGAGGMAGIRDSSRNSAVPGLKPGLARRGAS